MKRTLVITCWYNYISIMLIVNIVMGYYFIIHTFQDTAEWIFTFSILILFNLSVLSITKVLVFNDDYILKASLLRKLIFGISESWKKIEYSDIDKIVFKTKNHSFSTHVGFLKVYIKKKYSFWTLNAVLLGNEKEKWEYFKRKKIKVYKD